MKRIGFQLLRVIACAMVFIGHANEIIYNNRFACFYSFGSTAVMLFFILSGTLCYDNHKNKYSKNLLCEGVLNAITKYKKWFLLHFICFMARAVLMFLPEIELKVFSLKNVMPSMLINLLLIQSWGGVRSISFGYNSVTWYLSSLLFCYIFEPFFTRIISEANLEEKKLSLCLILMIRLVICNFKFSDEEMAIWALYVCPLTRLADFTIGILIGGILEEKKFTNFLNNFNTTHLELLALIFFLTTSLFRPFLEINNFFRFEELSIIVPCIVSILFFYSGTGKVSQMIGSSKTINYIASISMNIYMFHQICLIFCTQFLPIVLTPMQQFIFSLLITILLSIGYKKTQLFAYKLRFRSK